MAVDDSSMEAKRFSGKCRDGGNDVEPKFLTNFFVSKTNKSIVPAGNGVPKTFFLLPDLFC